MSTEMSPYLNVTTTQRAALYEKKNDIGNRQQRGSQKKHQHRTEKIADDYLTNLPRKMANNI